MYHYGKILAHLKRIFHKTQISKKEQQIMNNPNYQEDLNNFAEKLLDLTKEYENLLPPYEMVARMIAHGCLMSLCCAPNELLGIKTIHAALEVGISAYEKMHSLDEGPKGLKPS